MLGQRGRLGVEAVGHEKSCLMPTFVVPGAELAVELSDEGGHPVVQLHGLTSSRARDRVLSDDELRAYWVALRHRDDPIAAALKVSLLLGGQRIVQLLRVRWQDYDRTASTITAVATMLAPSSRVATRT